LSVTVSQLVQKIVVEGDTEAKAKLSGMNDAAEKTSGGFKGMLANALSFAGGQAIFNLVGSSVGFLKDQLTDCFKESMDAQASMAQTESVIKSTGDASGMSAQQIADMAGNLSHLTEFSDDTIQSGENMLLTFTNIGKDVFPQATKTLLDLSQAMGGDVKGSAIQLGKALNDPEKGITALTRVGVTFTEEQKKQIKVMQDAGNMAGAQKIILAELSKEFGGSAEAAGKTFGGQLIIAKQRLADVKQQIGDALMPALVGMTTWLNSAAMPVLEGFGNWFAKSAVPGIQKFGSEVGSVFNYIGNVFKSVGLMELRDSWKAVSEEFDYSIRHIGALVQSVLAPTLKLIKTDADPVAQVIQNLAKGGVDILSGALWLVSEAFVSVDKQLRTGKGPLIDFANGVNQFIPPLQNIANLIKNEFVKELNDVSTAAKQVGTWFQTSVVPALKEAWPSFQALAITILTTVIPALIQIRGILVDVIEHGFKVLAPFIGQMIPPLIQFEGIIAGGLSIALRFLVPLIMQVANGIGILANFLISSLEPIIKQLVVTWQTQLVPAFQEMAPILQPLGMLLGALAMIAGTILVVALGLLVGVIKGVVTAFVLLLTGVIQAVGGIVQVVMGFVTVISGILAFIVDLFTGNWTNLGNDLMAIWNGILNMLGGFGNIFMGIVGGLCLAVAGFFWGLVTGVIDFFRYLFDALVGHSIVIDLVNGILNWIGKIGPGIMAAIASIPGIFMNVWNTCIADATSAGANICNGIANGIRGAIAGIGSAIASVTQFISDHLPHSPAKIGPLMHLAEQGSSIVDQISIGLLAGMPKLNDAMTTLTKPVSMSLTPGSMSNGVNLATIGSANNQQPIYIQNFIDGKLMTDNTIGPRIVKSARTNGPLRGGL
jgi:Prophage tail length tape measure protein